MNCIEILKKNVGDSVESKLKFIHNSDNLKSFQLVTSKIIDCYQKGGRLFIAGNGGSAADAQHLAAEFVCRLGKDRAPIAAEALTVDSSVLTAIGNDYGFDKIFTRQIEAKMRKNDIFLAISTSGQSTNIVNALKLCQKLGISSILLSANEGGMAKDYAEFSICVSGNRTSTIQETHILIAHTICECVESDYC